MRTRLHGNKWSEVPRGSISGSTLMGTMFGAVNMASTLGMAMGPWAGGWLYDAYASYFWLYIGSFGIGLGAVAIAIAFTFRPPREISIELPSPTSRKARSSQGRTVQAGAGSRLPPRYSFAATARERVRHDRPLAICSDCVPGG
jgi:MFS family permease